MNGNHLDTNAPKAADATAAPKASAKVSPPLTAWQRLRLIFKVVEIRLRFIAILVLVALFVGYWDTIQNHWEKQTRSDGAVYSVSS